MENDDFLSELEQMTNSLDKDYNKVVNSNDNPTQKKPSSDVIKNPPENKQQENPFINNNNQNNPFANFGMPFGNPNMNMNPEDCFKELQKLMESDIGLDDNDPESKEMFNLLGT